MLRKEESAYQVSDYLSHLPVDECGKRPIDPVAREAILKWYLQIIELCGMSLNTAAIAVSILDRFSSSPAAKEFLTDRNKFKLASLAAIYTAIKIHEKETISSAYVAKLSGGVSTKEDVERMEMKILQTISWLLNPPTAIWFAQSFLRLLHLDSKQLTRSIEGQVVHSILKYKFCTVRQSEIAAAAVANSLEAVYGRNDLVRRMESVLRDTANMDGEQMHLLRSELAKALNFKADSAVAKSNTARRLPSNRKKSKDESSFTHSPKTVITTSR